MPQINQLPTRTPVAGDTIPFYSSNNGDASKASFTAISTLMSSLIGVSGGASSVTQYKAMTSDASATINSNTANTWLVVTPDTSGWILTLTIPDVADATDMMQITISTSNSVRVILVIGDATFYGTYDGTIPENSTFVIKYDAPSMSWHIISGELVNA
jgi:hypothetical protein